PRALRKAEATYETAVRRALTGRRRSGDSASTSSVDSRAVECFDSGALSKLRQRAGANSRIPGTYGGVDGAAGDQPRHGRAPGPGRAATTESVPRAPLAPDPHSGWDGDGQDDARPLSAPGQCPA